MGLPIWAAITGLSRIANAALKTPAGKEYTKLVVDFGKTKGKQLFNKYVSSNPWLRLPWWINRANCVQKS